MLDAKSATGRINPDLSLGSDSTAATPLLANEGLACPGVKLHGAGFIVTPKEAEQLGLGRREGLENHIRPYLNGRHLLQRSRGVMVIHLFGLDGKDVRQRFPEVYQHLLAKVWDYEVKDEKTGEVKREGRKYNACGSYRNLWWIHGEPRKDLRPALAGLKRYIATVETAKHRIFQFFG